MRRLLRPLLSLFVVGGLVLAAWPLGQWTYGRWSQNALEAQWRQEQAGKDTARQIASGLKLEARKPSSGARSGHNHSSRNASASPSASNDSPALAVASSAPVARWPLTKLSIPSINLDTFVAQGWDDAALRRGPGHMPQSAPAGQGNCVVAGHRNIYGSPFGRIEEIVPGAIITLQNRDGTFNYIVDELYATPDTNMGVVAPRPTGQTPFLTILTCTVPHTNNRIVVQASLTG